MEGIGTGQWNGTITHNWIETETVLGKARRQVCPEELHHLILNRCKSHNIFKYGHLSLATYSSELQQFVQKSWMNFNKVQCSFGIQESLGLQCFIRRTHANSGLAFLSSKHFRPPNIEYGVHGNPAKYIETSVGYWIYCSVHFMFPWSARIGKAEKHCWWALSCIAWGRILWSCCSWSKLYECNAFPYIPLVESLLKHPIAPPRRKMPRAINVLLQELPLAWIDFRCCP